MKTRLVRLVSFLLAASVALAASGAWAHAVLKSSIPAKDAEVPAPREIALQFNEKLEPAFSTAKLVDSHGKVVETGKAEMDNNDPSIMKLAAPALASGKYTVQFTAVGHDGHRRKGEFSFKVK